MSKPALFITRRIPASVLARLQPACEIDLYTGDVAIPREDLLAHVRGKQALMCLLTDRIDRELLDAGRDLRIVANIAVGYNNVDVHYAHERGILVTNTPDVLTESVADFTWALILALTRRISEGERVMRSGTWKGWALDFMLGTDVRGKQLGLIGMGRIGRAVAARAPAFGMRVAYADDQVPDVPGAERLSLDRLLTTSDVVSLHVPLVEATRHLIDKRALTRMKRSAYLINTARGPVIDEEALAWALGQHLLAGAALDVYEREPAVDPALLTMENVLLVPHLGSATTETRTAMADLAASNVLAVLAGQPALTAVSA